MAILPAYIRRILGPESFPLVRDPVNEIEPQVYQATPLRPGRPQVTPVPTAPPTSRSK